MRLFAAFCGFAFGVIELLLAVEAYLHSKPHILLWVAHLAVALIAIAVSVALFWTQRHRLSFVIAMAIALLWKAPAIVFSSGPVLAGVWRYTWSDWIVFAPMLLPPMALLAALLADGGASKLFALLRRWPNQEPA